MNPDQLRLILAEALDGAAERLRAGINATPGGWADDASTRDPLPGVVRQVLNVEDVANLLGVSRERVYESIRSGAIPAVRMGRRVLVPTQELRSWLAGRLSEDAGR
jgi:excisionase family DNA binding protein